MRTGTKARRGVYKQCANIKCKVNFYVPPGQQDIRCCSLDCKAARKAQERAGLVEATEPRQRARRDAIGLRKAVFDDSALVDCLMGKAPKVDPGKVTLKNSFPGD